MHNQDLQPSKTLQPKSLSRRNLFRGIVGTALGAGLFARRRRGGTARFRRRLDARDSPAGRRDVEVAATRGAGRLAAGYTLTYCTIFPHASRNFWKSPYATVKVTVLMLG